MTEWKKSVSRQRAALYNMLVEPMSYIAVKIAENWGGRERLDQSLMAVFDKVPNVTFLYIMDRNAQQLSSNMSRNGLVEKDFGRDRSDRPYMREKVPESGMLLSDAYISLRSQRPSLTAIQRICYNGADLGYVGADFDLRDLPLTSELYEEPHKWQQLKGDPAIRGSLFQQRRSDSLLDQHIDGILPTMEELITEHGVFHSKIHFSSSRATIYLVDDPYRYRILNFEALSDPDICLAFPCQPYPQDALVPESKIRPILEGFKLLRFNDEVIYLRAGSLNIFNGMISLNFSCDGSHYMPYREFLSDDSAFRQSLGLD